MAEPSDARWPVVVDIPVAWGEMDAYGHVNNAVYLRWLETARIAYFIETGVTERMDSDGIGPILARISVDFRLALSYPDTVRVGTTVSRLGSASFDMHYGLTSSVHGGKQVAESQAVVVMVDYRTGKSVSLWDELRERIRRVSHLENA